MQPKQTKPEKIIADAGAIYDQPHIMYQEIMEVCRPFYALSPEPAPSSSLLLQNLPPRFEDAVALRQSKVSLKVVDEEEEDDDEDDDADKVPRSIPRPVSTSPMVSFFSCWDVRAKSYRPETFR